MKLIFKCAKCLLFLICLSMLGCASKYPREDFNDQERTHFKEAPNLFSIKVIEGLYPSSGFSWVDDHTLMLGVTKLPNGWEAVDSELPKIIFYDINTWAITETEYRGILVCYSKGRMILNTRPYGAVRTTTDFFTLNYGGKPEKIITNGSPLINYNDCSVLKDENGLFIVNEAHESGMIKISIKPDDAGNRHFEFYDREGKQLAESTLPYKISGLPIYTPFNNASYVAGVIGYHSVLSGYPYAGALLFNSGKVELIKAEPFLNDLANQNIGSASLTVAKTGYFWQFRPWFSHWKMQGLYFTYKNQLFRLDNNSIYPIELGSPDGCLFFYTRGLGNPGLIKTKFTSIEMQLVEINVCNESE